MPRSSLQEHFTKLDTLITEINELVPAESYRQIKFRSDLAGLLIVAIVATYENCVKQILIEHAVSHGDKFGDYVQKDVDKLNSRIRVADLQKYCDRFNPIIKENFKNTLKTKKRNLLDRVGQNIEGSYERLLDWRHQFAHSLVTATTIEEAARTHLFGKRIIYILDASFDLGQEADNESA